MKSTSPKECVQILCFLVAFCYLFTCDGQEVPLFTAPKFSDVSYRQDFCTRHRLVEEGEIQRRDALHGINLHTALFQYQINSETRAIDETHPNVAVEFLDELARRAGFEWRNSYGVVDSPQGNETWTDVLLWSSGAYDLVGDWFLSTELRVELGILFPESWIDASLVMVKKSDTEETSFHWNNFLRPFTTGVWVLLAVTLVISGLVYYLLDYLHCLREQDEMDVSLLDSVFIAAWTFTGHNLHSPKSSATRFIVFSLCFLCLLIVAAYTANLASFLVMKNSPKPVIDDFSKVITSGLSCCVGRSGPIYEHLKKHYPMTEFVLIDEDEPGTEIFRSLDRSECDILVTEMYIVEKRKRSSEYNADCNLEWFGKVVKDLGGHFPLMDSYTLCSSLVSDVLNVHMLEMKLDGTYDEMMERHLSRISTQTCTSEEDVDEDSDRLNIYHVGGIFLVHLFAIVIATTGSLIKLYLAPKAKMPRILKQASMSFNMGSLTLPSFTTNRVQIQDTEVPDSKSECQLDKNEENVSWQLQKMQAEVCKVLLDLKKLENNMAQRKIVAAAG